MSDMKQMKVVWGCFCMSRMISVLLVLVLVATSNSKAQHEINFKYIDSLSFAAYEKGDWKSLIELSNKSVELGFDYFYLQMRMGIAYFTLGQYRKAAVHLEKALEFNSSDQFARNLLRQSYEWGGMQMEAAWLEKRFDENPALIQWIRLYAGLSFSGSNEASKQLDLDGNEDIYGEINRPGDFTYGSLGVVVAPGKGYRLGLNYSKLQLNNYQLFSLGELGSLSHKYNLIQHQVSAVLPIRIKHGLYVLPELDLLILNSEPKTVWFDTISNMYRSSIISNSTQNYVAGLKFIRNLPASDIGLSLSRSNLNGKEQWQTSVIAAIYPFHNLNFYTYSRFYTLFEENQVRIHYKQLIGFKANRFLWLQAGIHFGKMENAADENAGLMYNTYGRVIYNAMASMIFVVNSKLNLQLDFNMLEMKSPYITFNDLTNYTANSYNYKNIHLKGGLIWNL